MPTERTKRLYDIFLNVPAVTTDSRNVREGSLFFALRGETFDGNAFAAKALSAGASYAVVDDETIIPSGQKDKYIPVPNVLEALQQLAAHHRRQLDIPVIALTGTNGKTTTKELTAAVLGRKYRVSATEGNLNNHIGVPLSLLAINKNAQIAVIEMGASAQGEIAMLCHIAAPDYGLVTNIGRAHLEGFGGPEGVRKGKGELYDYLAANGGTAIVREDDPVLSEMVMQRKGLRTIFYNSDKGANLENNLAGSYNIYNMAAAVEIGEIFGVPEQDIKDAISEYRPDSDRSRILTTSRGNTVIADCYNANPSSMREALTNFNGGTVSDDDGNPLIKVAILGDMLELGEWSVDEHLSVIRQAVEGNINKVLFVGENFEKALKKSLKEDIIEGKLYNLASFSTTEELYRHLENTKLRNTSILLKGSRGMRLEKIIDLL